MGAFSDSESDLQDHATHFISLNQQACWPIRNRTHGHWWKRAVREPWRWACVQVPDSRTGELVRDIFIAPDGRIAVGQIKDGVATVQETSDHRPEWNLDLAYKQIITTLHRQSGPCIIPL